MPEIVFKARPRYHEYRTPRKLADRQDLDEGDMSSERTSLKTLALDLNCVPEREETVAAK